MTTTTSLLHTALQNLHVAQQVAHHSQTPRPASSVGSAPSSRAASRPLSRAGSDDEDEFVAVGKGTAPGTPIPGKGQVLGQRIKTLGNDPVSMSMSARARRRTVEIVMLRVANPAGPC